MLQRVEWTEQSLGIISPRKKKIRLQACSSIEVMLIIKEEGAVV